VQGADAVRAVIGGARQLYDRQDFNFAGPWGDNSFIEDYTAEVRGAPVGAVHLIRFNADGQAQHIIVNYRPLSSLMFFSRLLREKFVLGLFDQPFLEVDGAVATIGRADFVAEGEAAQRAAIVRLSAAESGPAALPLAGDQAVYVENIAPTAAARLGRLVDDPVEADLAVLRINAPYEPRPGGFESFFHAGSLEFAPQECERIVAICRQVPTIVVLFLDRPAVVPEIAGAAAALLVEFGARDDAVADVLLGAARARGRLPFDLPSSMRAVAESRSDVPFDTADPLFRFGDGILSS